MRLSNTGNRSVCVLLITLFVSGCSINIQVKEDSILNILFSPVWLDVWAFDESIASGDYEEYSTFFSDPSDESKKVFDVLHSVDYSYYPHSQKSAQAKAESKEERRILSKKELEGTRKKMKGFSKKHDFRYKGQITSCAFKNYEISYTISRTNDRVTISDLELADKDNNQCSDLIFHGKWSVQLNNFFYNFEINNGLDNVVIKYDKEAIQ